MRYNIGIDIGGTFTDFVAFDSKTSRLFSEKILTTPGRPADAVMQGLQKLVLSRGIKIEEIDRIFHATTLATNAVIERKGVRTGLVTTAGFEDVLDIRKGLRYNQYDLNIQIPKPYVPRFLRRGVSERMFASGEIRNNLDPTEFEKCVSELVDENIESVAICFLHSYANPVHERKAKDLVRDKFPNLVVSCSHEITSQAREYERTSTTVIDAYIKPIIQEYIDDLTRRLSELGFSGKLLLMTCTGGIVDIEVAKNIPVLLLESGPVAGVSMGLNIAKKLDVQGMFSFDMGGTTAKGCLVRNGRIEKSYEFEAARFDKFRRGSGVPVSIPVVKLIETGSGGGSIARLDQLGMVRVGPESAGSSPGPACYGLGGTEATVTDSDLILGYLDESYFVGGAMSLRADFARSSIKKKIADQLNIPVEDAAWLIHERVNEDVASAFRLYASEIGVDYRKYSFMPFGGAGPVHASRIARKLGLGTIVIPPRAGVFSAEGLLVTPISIDLALSKRIELSDLNYKEYSDTFEKLIDNAKSLLSSAEGRSKTIQVSRSLDICYHGQGYEVPLTLTGKQATRKEYSNLMVSFEDAYLRKYSITKISNLVDITSFKVNVSSMSSAMSGKVLYAVPSRPKSSREAFDPDSMKFRTFKLLNRYSLKSGDSVNGP
ncbi:MAG TPA: hydantoinase/oxoprolinase family protein, partial [Nitrososphaerales archaeon]|nr:hydantoinase/oxoprolinase family protein [Nitrososphaerales archaeon]